MYKSIENTKFGYDTNKYNTFIVKWKINYTNYDILQINY